MSERKYVTLYLQPILTRKTLFELIFRPVSVFRLYPMGPQINTNTKQEAASALEQGCGAGAVEPEPPHF